MKKKAVMGLAGIAAVAVVGGTWAYWNQDLSVANSFQSGNFDSDIVEEFTPKEGWVPGETVEKVVSVKNSGNVDMAIETTISQIWTSEEGEAPTVKFKGEDGLEYAAQIQWGTNVAAYAAPGVHETAQLLGIETEVESFEAAPENTWILVDSNEMQDGSESLYFIYNGIVGENGETAPLLTSVTMNPEIQSGVISKAYTVAEDGSLITTELKSNFNYEAADYMMTVHAKTVQATYDAVKEVFSAALEMDESSEDYIITDFASANGLDKPQALESSTADAE